MNKYSLVLYSSLALLQIGTYRFLRPLNSAPNAAFLSFIPVLGIAMLQSWRTWPLGKGSRMERFFQDFTLSLGAGIALFLAVMVFQFLIVALGANPTGLFSELIGVTAFLAFWASFGLIFHYQRERAQHLGMDWTQLETPDDDPSVSLEYATMSEIEKALHLLNLDADLDEKSLRDRYHQLCLLYHPDRLSTIGGNTRDVAQKEFQRIQNSYELLKIALKNNRL